MRGRYIAVITFVLLGSSVLAQTPTTNKIGLFFDLDYWWYCWSVQPMTTVTMYIVLVEPDFANLYGWEAALISADGRTFVLDSEIMGGGENLGRGKEFQVTYPDPMPTTSRTVLCSMSVMPLTTIEQCLYLTGVSHPSLADPRPLVWPTPTGPIPIDTYAPYENGVMAAISDCYLIDHPYTPCTQVVPTVQQSWGTLKSTYR